MFNRPPHTEILTVPCRRPRSPFRPATGDFVLLSHPRFVGEPDFYRLAVREARSDLIQLGGNPPF